MQRIQVLRTLRSRLLRMTTYTQEINDKTPRWPKTRKETKRKAPSTIDQRQRIKSPCQAPVLSHPRLKQRKYNKENRKVTPVG